MSSDTKTPKTPATSSRKKAMNSRVRSSMRQETSTPASATMPVSSTMGALSPSTPT